MIGIAGVVVVAYRRGAEDAPVILPMGSYSDVRERAEKAVASGIYTRVVACKPFAVIQAPTKPKEE
mgnify:CR=1 FL=1